jgi:hypothetical protein
MVGGERLVGHLVGDLGASVDQLDSQPWRDGHGAFPRCQTTREQQDLSELGDAVVSTHHCARQPGSAWKTPQPRWTAPAPGSATSRPTATPSANPIWKYCCADDQDVVGLLSNLYDELRDQALGADQSLNLISELAQRAKGAPSA